MSEQLHDTIERSVVIEAPVDRVWRLMSTPGWWVNTGEITEHELRYDGDQVTVVTELGEFLMQVVELREPTYAAFRWLGGATDPNPEQDLRTLVELHLREVDGGVEVRVVESGWAGYEPTEWLQAMHRDNVGGWEQELTALRTHLVEAA